MRDQLKSIINDAPCLVIIDEFHDPNQEYKQGHCPVGADMCRYVAVENVPANKNIPLTDAQHWSQFTSSISA